MQKKTFQKRCLEPVFFVMAVFIVSFIVYSNSYRIDSKFLHQLTAMISGLLMIISIIFGALVIYPLSFFRGATAVERITVGFIPALSFDIYEIYILSGVYSLPESLYYVLNPISVGVFLIALGFMGFCELVCRWIIKHRGEQIKVLTMTSISSIAVMFGGLYVVAIWADGAPYFDFFQEIYLVLFV